MNSSSRLSKSFDNKSAINVALPINFQETVVMSLPSLSIFLISFPIGTEKDFYFSVLVPKTFKLTFKLVC